MKWKTTKQGDKRIVKKFAYLPVIIDEYTVWLEIYYISQEYRPVNYGYEWCNIRMATKDNKNILNNDL